MYSLCTICRLTNISHLFIGNVVTIMMITQSCVVSCILCSIQLSFTFHDEHNDKRMRSVDVRHRVKLVHTSQSRCNSTNINDDFIEYAATFHKLRIVSMREYFRFPIFALYSNDYANSSKQFFFIQPMHTKWMFVRKTRAMIVLGAICGWDSLNVTLQIGWFYNVLLLLF